MKKTVVTAVILAMGILWAWGAVQAQSPIRLIPQDSVNIIFDDGMHREIRSEVPLPEGLMLESRGQAMIQGPGLQAVAQDGTSFAIVDAGESWDFNVQHGRMDFAFRPDAKPILFTTAHGIFQVEPTIASDSYNAMIPMCVGGAAEGEVPETSGSMVRGYLVVNGEDARLVMEEGFSRLAYADTQCLLQSGQGIQLVQGQVTPLATGTAVAAASTATAGGGGAGGPVMLGGVAGIAASGAPTVAGVAGVTAATVHGNTSSTPTVSNAGD